MSPPGAVVIGAGISGLTTAWRLKERGVSVAVIEAADEVGDGRTSRARPGASPPVAAGRSRLLTAGDSSRPPVAPGRGGWDARCSSAP